MFFVTSAEKVLSSSVFKTETPHLLSVSGPRPEESEPTKASSRSRLSSNLNPLKYNEEQTNDLEVQSSERDVCVSSSVCCIAEVLSPSGREPEEQVETADAEGAKYAKKTLFPVPDAKVQHDFSALGPEGGGFWQKCDEGVFNISGDRQVVQVGQVGPRDWFQSSK